MQTILRLLTSSTAQSNFSKVIASATELAKAEANYILIIQSALIKSMLSLVGSVAITSILFSTFIIGGALSLIIILPQSFPSVSQSEAIALSGVTLLGGIFLALYVAFSTLKKTKALISDYINHWRSEDDEFTAH